MIPRVPLDTLDFTSYTMNLGSRMVVDATRKQRPAARPRLPEHRVDFSGLMSVDTRIVDVRFVHDALLLVRVTGDGMEVLKRLVVHELLEGVRIVAAVSEDVRLDDEENYIWGLFTRFDCERDLIFTEQRLVGISPVYKGVMGIDATWKPGYPKPLEMSESIKRRVDERWDSYWR
jgi:4-hydroxy-3-polyprenylbenzoate decarboxylase